MKHNYLLSLKKSLASLAVIMGLCALAAAPAQAGYIVGTGSVSCGGGGSYSFYSYNWNYYCNAISWTVSRPDGTTGFYYGPSIYATMGNTPGTATISASGWCDPFTGGGFGQFETGYYVVSVGGGSLPTPSSISGSTHLCNNASGTYSTGSVSGASGYNWQVPSGWKINGISTTSLTTSSTSVTITAPSGSGTGTGSIRVRANSGGGSCTGNSAYRSRTVYYGRRSPNIVGPSTVQANSFADFFTNSLGMSNFSWTVPPNWNLISGQGTSSIFAVPASNSGYVYVTATSCGVTVSDNKFVQIGFGGPCDPFEPCIEPLRAGDGIQEAYSIEVFPNPVSDLVSVQASAGHQIAQVLVYNQLQQLVMEARPQAASAQLDLKRLDNGVYFLQVKGDAEEQQTHRIIVQH